jgi:hypothetical protein
LTLAGIDQLHGPITGSQAGPGPPPDRSPRDRW